MVSKVTITEKDLDIFMERDFIGNNVIHLIVLQITNWLTILYCAVRHETENSKIII